MKQWLVIVLIIFLVSCVPPAETTKKTVEKPVVVDEHTEQITKGETQETIKEAKMEDPGSEPIKKEGPKEVKVLFSSTAKGTLLGGTINRFIWAVKKENGDPVDLTRLEASKKEDFSTIEFKSQAQSGKLGTFSGQLLFKQSTEGTYYIRAMAQVGGHKYFSNVLERNIAPTEPIGQKTVKTSTGEKRAIKYIPVKIKNQAFIPDVISAKTGDIITFTNDDQLSHSITIDDLEFDETLRKGQDATLEVNETGTFPIRDTIGYARAVLQVSS